MTVTAEIQLLFCMLFSHAVYAQSPPAAPAGRIFIYQMRLRGMRADPIFCDGTQVASLLGPRDGDL